jgi:all-trans-retinol dehydrogenase (NAD+)
MKDVMGAKVLVTGGARGMGLLWARHFLSDGAAVVLWDRDAKALGAAKAELEADYPGKVEIKAIDVTDRKAVFAAAEATGPIDVLVNNAGIVSGGRFVDLDPALHAAVIDVNLTAAVMLCRAFLPGMVQRKSGRVVNIASAAGYLGTPYMAPYNASKWGLIGFTESLELEMAELGLRGIKFTLVCPSYVDTGMFAGVKAPFLVPLLKPEPFVSKAYRAFKRGRRVLREPLVVKLVPRMRGLLPTAWFNVISKILGVTSSMSHWTGRKD